MRIKYALRSAVFNLIPDNSTGVGEGVAARRRTDKLSGNGGVDGTLIRNGYVYTRGRDSAARQFALRIQTL